MCQPLELSVLPALLYSCLKSITLRFLSFASFYKLKKRKEKKKTLKLREGKSFSQGHPAQISRAGIHTQGYVIS